MISLFEFLQTKHSTYKSVDLGLPSGLLWCDRNIGSSSPEETGLFFQWGRTDGYTIDDKIINDSPKDKNTWGHGLVKCPRGETPIIKSGKKYKGGNLDLQDDAVHVNMKDNWRMPTFEETEELDMYTTKKFVIKNGIHGIEFTGKNGNSIFFPETGYFNGDNFDNEYNIGGIWTSSIHQESHYNAYPGEDKDTSNEANAMAFSRDTLFRWYDNRCCGWPVRGVCEK